MLTPNELNKLAIARYGKHWQAKMAREVVEITGCKERSATTAVHRLAKGISKPSALVEIALRLLTKK